MKQVSLLIIFIVLFACTPKNKKVKNVILMIGDGMGPGQISLLYYFLKNTQIKDQKNTPYAFERVNSSFAISQTAPYDKIVVDSACSATQLAIGKSSRSEMIGLDFNGNETKTILEKAMAKGLATGLVSDTRLTHATPASFAAHVPNRWSEEQIAQNMIKIAPDVLLSGGLSYFIPKGTERKITQNFHVKSKRNDGLDLIQMAKNKNYQVAYTKEQLQSTTQDKKILGLFTSGSYPDAIWMHQNKNNVKREIPSLLEMSQVAINKLSKNEKGFFLMIEGGQIDWAAHANDAATMLHEMLNFNETINWVIDWVKKHPDTLLVITADHETGGFGLGYNVANLPQAIKLEGDKFKNIPFRPNYNYGNFNVLDKLYFHNKSLTQIWLEYSKSSNKSNQLLSDLIFEATTHKLSKKQISNILATEPNQHQVEWHFNLKHKMLPKVSHYRDYYFDQNNTRTSLIAREFAADYNLVWGTSGHTANPVHVYTLGPQDVSELFSGQLTHPELGKKLQDVLFQ